MYIDVVEYFSFIDENVQRRPTMKMFSFLIHLMLGRSGLTVNQSAKSETKANVEVAGSVFISMSLVNKFTVKLTLKANTS